MVSDHDRIFEQNRQRLRRLAYRLLGSLADADDIVQDVYVRWHRAEFCELHAPEAWLTTAVTRLCVDRMRARSRQREAYAGCWLPEPFSVVDPALPDRDLEIAADLSMALLVLLERLTPAERAVFLLHDAFEYSHGEIGVMIGKAEPACRQILRRARKHIHAGRPRFRVSDDLSGELVTRFLEALRSHDHHSLMMLMSEDATLATDSGGRVRATLKVVDGNDRIARLLVGVERKRAGAVIEKMMLINCEFGIVIYTAAHPVAILWFEIEASKITRVYRILNPDKLKGVPALREGAKDSEIRVWSPMALNG
jgi:RNA polymerase sigma-70 factor (ECF subfamily)